MVSEVTASLGVRTSRSGGGFGFNTPEQFAVAYPRTLRGTGDVVVLVIWMRHFFWRHE